MAGEGAHDGTAQKRRGDFDSPWKNVLDAWFFDFLEFFCPDTRAAVDTTRGYEMLDKEFQRSVPRSGRGRRCVDKLVKVWRLDGAEA